MTVAYDCICKDMTAGGFMKQEDLAQGYPGVISRIGRPVSGGVAPYSS